jgi:hypothetical protein
MFKKGEFINRAKIHALYGENCQNGIWVSAKFLTFLYFLAKQDISGDI